MSSCSVFECVQAAPKATDTRAEGDAEPYIVEDGTQDDADPSAHGDTEAEILAFLGLLFRFVSQGDLSTVST